MVDRTPNRERSSVDLTIAQTKRIAELKAALTRARDDLHRLCLERGSTEGYRATFDRINEALDA
jgi:hypothetical protein